MHRSLLLKAIVIGIMILAILIPLDMIRSTIAERQTFRQQAVASIAESYAGAQTVVGPVLTVPYRVDVPTTEVVNGVTRPTTMIEQRQWIFFPKNLRIDGEMKPQVRYRGLHKVRVYELHAMADSHFELDVPSQVEGGALHDIGIPVLSMGISDVRGLSATPRMRLNGHDTDIKRGLGVDHPGAGVHASLAALTLLAGQRRSFDTTLDFVLSGTEQLAIVPIAGNNRVVLESTWPSPQFAGRFLPHSESMGAAGFDAVWDTPALASSAQEQYLAGTNAKDGIDRLEVTLVDPVNIYTQADRASKYGLLFVLLTFVGFFMFETIKQLRIHPIQYLLAGLGLAIFFLLLLSLSEHIPFLWAYVIASAACIGLLGFYLGYVLRSRARGIGFATMLTALYAVLYGLLISEDNALVLGSMMLFAILAAIMVITRKIDWYALAPDSTSTTERDNPPDASIHAAQVHERASEGY